MIRAPDPAERRQSRDDRGRDDLPALFSPQVLDGLPARIWITLPTGGAWYAKPRWAARCSASTRRATALNSLPEIPLSAAPISACAGLGASRAPRICCASTDSRSSTGRPAGAPLTGCRRCRSIFAIRTATYCSSRRQMERQPRDVPTAGTGTTYRNAPSAPTHTHGAVFRQSSISDWRREADMPGWWRRPAVASAPPAVVRKLFGRSNERRDG